MENSIFIWLSFLAFLNFYEIFKAVMDLGDEATSCQAVFTIGWFQIQFDHKIKSPIFPLLFKDLDTELTTNEVFKIDRNWP